MKPGKHPPAFSLRLDMINQCVWRGQQSVSLTPKAFRVLRYLMDRPGQLVTKEELLNAAWPQVYVGEAALKVCIRRLRQTLGDESHEPRFIETVPWRGYRFIGAIGNAEAQTVRNSESTVQSPQSTTVHNLKAKTQRSALHVSRSTFHVQSTKLKVPAPPPQPQTPKWEAHSTLRAPHAVEPIGRGPELTFINKLLDSTFASERHTLFLTGEPGIGKTTVIEAFLAQTAADARCWTVAGQCIEHYGAGEPYLPLLVALEQLCRLPGNEALLASLRQYAPMWLVQMPTLTSAVEHKRLQRLLQGTTQERMMREFAELLSHLTMEKPLVLVIEDLHWSDTATVDLLAFLTQQHSPSRLFIIGTYRPDYVTDSALPLPRLVRELSTHGQCHCIALGFLDEAAVGTYVTRRFPTCAFLPTLTRAVYKRTDGNPLFMVNMIEYLLAQGVLRQEQGQWQLHTELADVHTLIPTNVQQLIEMQIDRLSPDDQHFLEAASVAGMEFSAAAVAAALDAPIPVVEERYTKFARRFHFLRTLGAGEWPNGTVAQQYAFIHSLYQSIFYQRIPAGKRAQLHCRIGQQEEQAYGKHAPQIAVELAVHFERGRNFQRAVHYRRHAAETALQRYAYQEAIEHLTIGLELLKPLPPSDERMQQEISFCSALGTALTATQGYASVAVERTYSRAYSLWQQAGKVTQPFSILLGLWGFANVRADLHTALTIAHQLLETAQTAQNQLWRSLAHNALGSTFFWLGNLSAAQQHYGQSLALNDPAHLVSADFVDTPGVIALSSLSVVFSHLGNFTQAQAYANQALTLAKEQEQHYSLALAQCHIAALHQGRRDFSATQEIAAAGMALSSDKGFPYCLACSTIQHGWARAMLTDGREGIEQIQQGVAAYQATGAVLWQGYFLALLAEAQLIAGQTTECLRTLIDGLTCSEVRGQLIPQAWLYRIKGELLLAQESKKQKAKIKNQKLEGPTPHSAFRTPHSEAEAYFRKAIDIAHAQHAKAIELRAAICLSHLWQQQGKDELAQQLLTPLCEQFDHSQDTADLREAREILLSNS